ncbi:carboxypeptidase [Parvularcula sp. ZS-1/3]|uniref:Carboxypeptidase n=1 Tax=Parvularcula mediterranea TaxID=2732508 RepID=A0A7Y3RKC6_9PROT|nr:M14 family metallopeptidase [Parvularcula mediterranea]NNU15146.1 carboxypeptidase [Parvularcula mediterranea]
MRILATLVASLSFAHAQLPFWEGEYDDDIPTLKEVLGHDNGEEITTPRGIIDYMEALEAASDGRMKLVQYAETWEGRPLVYGVIGSKENIENAERIKARLAEISDGKSLGGRDLERAISQTPAVTWLAYGVHGNEITGPDAGLALAYHLLAAEDDATVEKIFEETIVIIDPSQNPDGRARFTNHFAQTRGLEAQGATYAAERDEPWPGGRYNHMLFDMNRDWFTLSQPETRGKVAAVVEWNPVVFVDIHEMGSSSTYYFPPAARPFNPQLTENTREGQEILGKTIATAFDEIGQPYFTREVYDNFYPGFGDMWPALRGAVAMTFEQASPRGLKYDRDNGEALTYQKGVRNQFVSTLMTAKGIAENKERFLMAYAEDRATAIDENANVEDRFTLIDLSMRKGQAMSLGQKLVDQGIEVQHIEAGTTACGTEYADGAIVVDRSQADGRLVRTLLDRNTKLAEDYVKEQEGRRKRGLGHELYDVTAWSMPLMEGVTFSTCGSVRSASLEDGLPDQGRPELVDAEFGYVLPWDDATQAQFLIAALKDGLRGKTTGAAFEVGGETYGRGSVVFSHAMNEGLTGKLRALIAEHGGKVMPLDSSWVESGPNLGSRSFHEVSMPRVALAWGEGVSPLSVGSTRYVIERRLGLPVTTIRVRSMGSADLSRYDVILVAETWGFTDRLGSRGASAVKDWVSDGGVLVGFGSALDAFSSDSFGLLALKRENRAKSSGSAPASGSTVPGTELWSEEDYRKAIAPESGRPDRVPGVLVRAAPNKDHFMSAGYDEAVALFRGSTIYAPLKANQGTNVFTYKGADELLASGYLWDDVRTQLARKPYLVATNSGDGMVIGFAQDPTTRAYLGGLDLMLANALVMAPAYAD